MSIHNGVVAPSFINTANGGKKIAGLVLSYSKQLDSQVVVDTVSTYQG